MGKQDFRDELLELIIDFGSHVQHDHSGSDSECAKRYVAKHLSLIKQHRPKKREIKIQDSYSTKAARKEGYNTALDDYSNSLGIE